MGSIQTMLEDNLPGVYVHSLMIGNSVVEDTKNGFFLPVNQQVDMACKKIAEDPKLQNGFNLVFIASPESNAAQHYTHPLITALIKT